MAVKQPELRHARSVFQVCAVLGRESGFLPLPILSSLGAAHSLTNYGVGQVWGQNPQSSRRITRPRCAPAPSRVFSIIQNLAPLPEQIYREKYDARFAGNALAEDVSAWVKRSAVRTLTDVRRLVTVLY